MKRFVFLFAMLATVPASMANPRAAPVIDPARLSAHVRVLASDAFEGRGPGTPGEDRTLAYLTAQFRAIGARPAGEHGGWTQAVPMNRYRIGMERRRLAFGSAAPGCAWEPGEALPVSTRNPAPRVDLANAPLVFAGYGINAPELGWNDYAGLDAHGKIVVVLANDPDHEQTGGPFGGPALSYYGRPASKVEEAGRQGAAAILIIHHEAFFGLPWDMLRRSSGTTSGIPGADDALVGFTGYLRQDEAERLFRCAGLDLEQQRHAAQQNGFRARPLSGMTLSARFDVTTQRLVTHNLLAILPGTRHPDEYFIYTAHWDHLGLCRPEGEADRICNGALDNAGGVAGLLELARLFAAGPRPQRSILFIAMTLEESGLLGSDYYAGHPLYPLETTVGGINMDAVNMFGATNTMEVTGLGHTDLEDVLGAELNATRRRMQDDPNSVVGFYYRSDHFPFVKRGVPFLFAGSGWDLAERSSLGTRFHQPSDQWGPELNFASAARDIQLYYRVGMRLANSRIWPGWRPGTEFAALRARSDAARRR
jgi:Zn-dependent M28 family amino/carboxypeptidase